MKAAIEIFIFVTLWSVMVGCGVLQPLHAARRAAVESANQPGQTDRAVAVPEKRKHIPATVAASTSPVASAVAHIVHLMELAGVICLAVAGGLIYLGQLIPGIKCAVAGVALPVSAVWFNYHYGLVIAGILISSAAGFLWALNKKHPEYLAAAENNLFKSAHNSPDIHKPA